LKTSAKSKIGESVAGLLLALSAYLILNTINPTLVENRITISNLSLTITNLAEDLGHFQISGTKEKLSSDVTGFGPFTITGEGVIAGDYTSGTKVIRIVNKIYPLEMEKGPIGNVKAIVLHNTMGSTASGGWLAWAKQNNPASCHFIIEKDGTIWQNARLTKATNCTKADKKWEIGAKNNIGIEIVGCAINSKTGEVCDLSVPADSKVEAPTREQVQSTIFLINYLNEKFGTSLKDLLYHGQIASHKLPAEGEEIYKQVKDFIIKK
jgi:N-acetylmuramoyl-L-alanine amidase